MPRFDRQLSLMTASNWRGNCSVRNKAPGLQTSAQSPQNVQPCCEKSSWGRLRADIVMMLSLQAATQSPQPSHVLEKPGSAIAPGGSSSSLSPRQSPRKNCALDIDLIN